MNTLTPSVRRVSFGTFSAPRARSRSHFGFGIAVAFGAVLVACGGGADVPDSSKSNDVGETAQALASNGGGPVGYDCPPGSPYCTCTGDIDCNNMFSSGVCGAGPNDSVCQINGADVPRCRCRIGGLRTSGAPLGTIKVATGNLALSQQ